MDKNLFFEKLTTKLTDQQKQAVVATEGPILLLAVPGSGKTTVLVHRLAYMIYVNGIDPESILTVTYTVAATKDMSQRFEKLFGSEYANRLEFRTINGICQKIIMKLEELTGRPTMKLETDEKKISQMIAGLFRQVVDEFPTESDIKNVRTLIAYAKNMMLSEDEIKKLDIQGITAKQFTDIFNGYNKALRDEGLMDYDDQMKYALVILNKSPEILSFYREKFRYICVDEAQDTSKIQHAIIRMLVGQRNNIFMVGDEDQSIYGFRAAYPEALTSFEKDYDKASVLYMEENFRSSKGIVEAANRFIKKARNRHDKNMYSKIEDGDKPVEIAVKKREEQYSKLFSAGKNCKSETAVLYRDNESILPLVDMMERQKVPYRIKASDFSFFTSRIVTDISNIILFADNPYDEERFMQIYYKMNLYINKQTALMACEISRQRDIPITEALRDFCDIQDRQITHLIAMLNILDSINYVTGDEAVKKICNNLGYRDYLERSKFEDTKTFILMMLGKNTESGMDLLKRLLELSDIIKSKERDYNTPFILSTIHSSKGLEYDRVYIMDAFDGLFPKKRIAKGQKASAEDISLYEEERRLFYVAATRARRELYLFNVEGRSSFVMELLGTDTTPVAPASKTPVYGNFKQRVKLKTVSEEDPGFQRFCRMLGKDVEIFHKKRGMGTVVENDGKYIRIQFKDKVEKYSLKTLYDLDTIERLD